MDKIKYIVLLCLLLAPLYYGLETIDVQGKYPVRKSLKFTQQRTMKIELSVGHIGSLESKSGFLFIQLKADLPIEVEIYEKKEKPVSHTHLSLGLKEVLIHEISYDSKIYKFIEQNGYFYIRLINIKQGHEVKVDIGVSVSQSAELTLGDSYFLSLDDTRELPVQLKVPRTSVGSRLKLLALLDTGKYSYFKMYGNIGEKKLPSKKSHSFSLYEFNKKEFAETINLSSEDKCSHFGCNVNLIFKTKGVSSIGFRSLYSTDIVEKIEEYRPTYDTIGRNDVRHYVVDNPEIQDLEITCIPYEGDMMMYINPGTMGLSLNAYMYRLDSKATKRLMISKEIMKSMLAKNTKIYIAINTYYRASYSLTLEQSIIGVHRISPGMVETGAIGGGELKTHIMSFSEDELTLHEFQFRLHLISGDADLYFKPCGQSTSEICDISESEMNGGNSTAGVIKAPVKEAIKTIDFNAACNVPKGESIRSGYSIMKECYFGIFIKGNNKNNTGEIHYDFSIEDGLDSHQLVLNHFLRVQLQPNQLKYYHYNLKRAGIPKELHFTFDGRFGKVSACIMMSNSRPKFVKSNCDYFIEIDADQAGYSKNLRTLAIGEGTGAPEGTYYVMLESTNHASIELGAVEHDKLHKGDPKNYIARSLKAGVAISDRLPSLESIRYYTFKINLVDNIQTISIKILAKLGEFSIAVRNDDRKPDLAQGFWVSEDEHMFITRDDPMFKDNAEYIVAVLPRLSLESLGHYSQKTEKTLEYDIKFTYTDKHSIIQAGVPEIGILHSNKQCFSFEILSNWNNLIITKSMTSRSLTMFASIGADNFEPDGLLNDFGVESGETGFYIENVRGLCSESLKKTSHCHLYLCVYGKKNEKYSIMMNYNLEDRLPMTGIEGNSIVLPSINQPNEYHLIYHPDKDKDLEIIESSNFGVHSLEAICQRSTDKLDFSIFKNAKDKKSTGYGITEIFFSKEELTNLTDPVCLVRAVSTASLVYNDAKARVVLNFWQHMVIEFMQKMRELRNEAHLVDMVEGGSIRYYYFYASSPDVTIEIEAHPLDNGYLKLYVGKGKDTRPTSAKSIMSSYASNGNIIQLDYNFIKAKGFDDLKGYYVVGVESTVETHFEISWRHESSNVIYPAMNVPFILHARKGEVKHFEFTLYNFFGSESIANVGVYGMHTSFDIYCRILQPESFSVYRDTQRFPTFETSMFTHSIPAAKPYSSFELGSTTKGNLLVLCTLNTSISDAEARITITQKGRAIPLYMGSKFSDTIEPNVEFPNLYLWGNTNLKRYAFFNFIKENKDVECEVKIDGIVTKIKNHDVIPLQKSVTMHYYRGTSTWAKTDFKISCATATYFELTLYDDEHPIKLEMNKPHLVPTFNKVEYNEIVNNYKFELTSEPKELLVELRIATMHKFLSHYNRNELEKIFARLITFKFNKNEYNLNSGIGVIIKPTISFDYDKAYFYLTPNIGHYRILINWKGFFFENYVDMNGYTDVWIEVGDKRTTVAHAPVIKLFGFHGDTVQQNMQVINPITSGYKELSFVLQRCYGDFQINLQREGEHGLVDIDTQYLKEGVDTIYIPNVAASDSYLVNILGLGLKDLLKKESIGNAIRPSNWTAFSLQVVESDHKDFIIEEAKKSLRVDFSGNNAVISFNPITTAKDSESIYKVIISKNPFLVQYYQGCGDLNLASFPSLSTYTVHTLPPSGPTSSRLSYTLPLISNSGVASSSSHGEDLSGGVYYIGVTASVRASDSSPFIQTSYRVLSIELSGFAVPLEVLSALVGIFGLLAVSWWVLGKGKHSNSLAGWASLAAEIGQDELPHQSPQLEQLFCKVQAVLAEEPLETLGGLREQVEREEKQEEEMQELEKQKEVEDVEVLDKRIENDEEIDGKDDPLA